MANDPKYAAARAVNAPEQITDAIAALKAAAPRRGQQSTA
jgi:hypothetical protein